MKATKVFLLDEANGYPITSFAMTIGDGATAAMVIEKIRKVRGFNINGNLYSMPCGVNDERGSLVQFRAIRQDWNTVLKELEVIVSDAIPSNFSNGTVVWCVVGSRVPRSSASRRRTIPETDRTRLELCTKPRPSVAADIRKKLNEHSPSTNARNSNLCETECSSRPDAVYDGRPAHLTGPSISIYHPIFSRFQERLESPPSPFSPETLRDAHDFIKLSAAYYQNETLRQNAIRPSLTELVGSGKFSFSNISLFYDDEETKLSGHMKAECPLRLNPMLYHDEVLTLLAVLKNGLGSGDCDPTEQAAKYFTRYVTAEKLEPLRQRSCMPAFLLAIIGPYIMVSGAIYLDGVVSERLTDMISLVPVLSSQHPLGHPSARDALVHRVAHLFCSLKECLEELGGYYGQLSTNDPVPPLVPHPHFSSFTADDGQRYTLEYQDRVFPPRSEQMVFTAEAQAADQKPITCIVKFASAYCADAHKILYDEGAAPRLLYCTFEKSVGKVCVVTEYVPLQDGKSLGDEGLRKLYGAIGVLHAKGYVFGDLRDPNVLVDESGMPKVIDFDWSGKEGEVSYPMDINTDGSIQWPTGMRPGGKITADHDREMLKIHFPFDA